MGGPRATRNHLIAFEANAHGGRLKYFDEESTPEFWDEIWREESARIDYSISEAGFMKPHLRRSFLKHVKPGARVLEAGCGLARFTVAAHALGYRAEGVDFSPGVISFLQRRFPDIPFQLGDVRNLESVPDCSYGAVYSPGVCEHFEEGPDRVLRESHRILERGGLAFVHTPWFNWFRRCLVRAGMFRRPPSGEFFQYAFSTGEMRHRLEAAGFRIIDAVPFDALGCLGDHIPGVRRLRLGPLQRRLGALLDGAPGLRSMGHCCIWVAKRDDGSG